MTVKITVTGLDAIIKRMRAFPGRLRKSMQTTMEAALLAVQGSVPPYPAPPASSTYRRTGTLGRSLGVTMRGRRSGQASIYQVRTMGSGQIEGVFGTNLKYAPHVIGDGTQAPVHRGRWWTIKTVAKNASKKVVDLFAAMADELAAFLDRAG